MVMGGECPSRLLAGFRFSATLPSAIRNQSCPPATPQWRFSGYGRARQPLIAGRHFPTLSTRAKGMAEKYFRLIGVRVLATQAHARTHNSGPRFFVPPLLQSRA